MYITLMQYVTKIRLTVTNSNNVKIKQLSNDLDLHL